MTGARRSRWGLGLRAALALAAAAAVTLALSARADAFLYWANQDTSTIGRANLDGTGVDLSFITGVTNPQGVAVDDEHVFWVSQGEESRTSGGADRHGSNW